MHFDIVLHKM